MDRKQVDDLVQQARAHRAPLADIKQVSKDKLLINGHPYDLIVDNHHTFDLDAFKYRYNPVYSNHGYILGDWSYDQLRLTGFYDDNCHVADDLKISYLQDFLMEYCNFGVSYFILKNADVTKRSHKRHFKRRSFHHRPSNRQHKSFKRNPHKQFRIAKRH